ncbi:MAG: flagellar basal body-associated FliL family protein [Burkholderiales bacterium]|nr:flagellar basal body-associated FliL family protein [Burkholderiales bacterium]
MSNAAAAAAEAAPPPKSKKTLIIIVAAVLVLALVGAGAMLLLKKKPAEDEGDEDAADAHPAKVATKHDPKAVPTFVPLDVFVVNLADKEAERYAQVGITLEIAEAKLGDQIKVYMPAIRHAVLMVLADKTAAQLIDREGKVELAREVQRETSRVLGAEIDDAEAESAGHEAGGKKDPKKGSKKKKKKAAAELPIRAVHFSSFIVQ